MKTPAPLIRFAKFVLVPLSLMLVGGCLHHEVEFQGADWHYTTGSPRIDRSIVVVIDQATLDQKVAIHSFTTGIANSWDVQPGEMLKQVAEVELPQMFTDCHVAESVATASAGGDTLVLELKIFHYAFEDFQAHLTMHARTSLADGRMLFEKDYNSVGPKQGGKMFFGGAFGMKSAVRQSSLAAFKTAFAELRSDLAPATLTSRGDGNQNPPAESRPATGP